MLPLVVVFSRGSAGVKGGGLRPLVSLFAVRFSLFLALLFLASCAKQEAEWKLWNEHVAAKKPPVDKPEPPPESNIVRVNKFFSQTPWLSFKNDGSGTVDGVSFTVYLESASQPKGVFGTGSMVVLMYRLNHDPLGREVITPVYQWELPPDKAYPWRSKKSSAMGWGYGMRLRWPENLDVGGKPVVFIVKYIREDGREISSSRQVLKVPVGGTIAAPPKVNEGPVAKSVPSRAQ